MENQILKKGLTVLFVPLTFGVQINLTNKWEYDSEWMDVSDENVAGQGYSSFVSIEPRNEMTRQLTSINIYKIHFDFRNWTLLVIWENPNLIIIVYVCTIRCEFLILIGNKLSLH